VLQMLGHDIEDVALALRHLQRNLAGKSPDAALELSHSGLASVAADDGLQSFVCYVDLLFTKPGLSYLPGNQIPLGDVQFLLLAIAGEPDDFHSISQSRRNWAQLIRRRDEEDSRQVERQVDIVIPEREVLRGIEYLEKRRSRIASEVHPELVDFIQHHHRIIDRRAAQRLNDAAGH